MFIAILKLIRPQQWLKNSFIFLPMFFAGRLTDIYCWIQSMWAFIAFSFIASAIYCINDIKDVEADGQHPRKCHRPIASGAIPVNIAIVITIILISLSYLILFTKLSATLLEGVCVISVYLVLNLAYCFRLKRYAIIDVFIISLGFVLRLALGGMVCDIWLSPWIVCLTFLLALFLAFAKRRDDVLLHEQEGILARKNIVRYNSEFMNQTLGILASVTMVCYIIYSVSPDVEMRLGSGYIYITSIFVLAGILRYLQITVVDRRSGSPTKILISDRFIQATILGWIVTFFLIIYILK